MLLKFIIYVRVGLRLFFIPEYQFFHIWTHDNPTGKRQRTEWRLSLFNDAVDKPSKFNSICRYICIPDNMHKRPPSSAIIKKTEKKKAAANGNQ